MWASRRTVSVVGLALLAALAAVLFADEPTAGLTLVGALVVAVVAAEAADVRQSRQLVAERDRLDHELEAERTRHAAALAHDRELADIADLRALLDQAAVELHRTDEAIGGVKLAYTQHGRSMGDQDPDARRELKAAGRAVDSLVARLSVRLGPQEEAVMAFRAAADAALEVSRAVGWLEDDDPNRSRERHGTIDAGRQTFREGEARFIAAAVELAGTGRGAGQP